MTEVSDRGGAPDSERRYRTTPDQPPSEAVVEAVAEVPGTAASGADDPTALPPLYDVVDTDALNALFERAWDSDVAGVSVTFRYADCIVTVEGTGGVGVRKIE